MFEWNVQRMQWETDVETDYAGVVKQEKGEFFYWVTDDLRGSKKGEAHRTTMKFRKATSKLDAMINCAYMLGEVRTHSRNWKYSQQAELRRRRAEAARQQSAT